MGEDSGEGLLTSRVEECVSIYGSLVRDEEAIEAKSRKIFEDSPVDSKRRGNYSKFHRCRNTMEKLCGMISFAFQDFHLYLQF
jgi:hypothetical protein